MIKRTSISDVANALSVSVSTVSRALHDHPSISDEMKRQVRRKTQELNYRPNSYAVNMKKGSCKTIAVIVPLINRNFFSSAINGIEEIAQQNGYDVMIYQSRNEYEHERHIVNSLSFGKVDGVIASVADSSKDYLHYSQMIEYGMPLVFFDRILTGLNVGSVRLDDALGSYKATEHFLKQGLKKIYHFAGPRNVIIWEDRAKGYAKAMSDYGIEIDPSWIHESPTVEANGAKYMQQLINDNNLPEAINFAGDYAALGAMKVMRDNGISIPISGYACEPFCSVLFNPLTSVNQFSEEMGRKAAQMLLDKIDGKSYNNIVIEPELIVRESSIKKERE